MEKDHKKPTVERAVCSTTRAFYCLVNWLVWCRYYYTGYSIWKSIFFIELGNQKLYLSESTTYQNFLVNFMHFRSDITVLNLSRPYLCTKLVLLLIKFNCFNDVKPCMFLYAYYLLPSLFPNTEETFNNHLLSLALKSFV